MTSKLFAYVGLGLGLSTHETVIFFLSSNAGIDSLTIPIEKKLPSVYVIV